MISGIGRSPHRHRPLRAMTKALLALTALLCTAPAMAQNADSDWILQKLARPAPMRTDFVEVRDSPLLKAPLRLSGEYRRPDANTLVREVRAPYAETTTITTGGNGPGQATIARAGKSPRTFSLARVPELAALQASFGALLAGDRKQLQRHYRIQASGTRQQWTLLLTPAEQALAGSVRDITLYGRGAELRCIETRPAQSAQVQRTLLASAARSAQPAMDGKALAALCRQGD